MRPTQACEFKTEQSTPKRTYTHKANNSAIVNHPTASVCVVAREKVAGRRLVLMGDLNVAPLETDVWNHKRLLRSVGHTPVESEHMAKALKASGLIDAARHFVPPDQPLYTWWGYRFAQSYEKNYGWRLDHVWVSPTLLRAVGGFRVVKETRTWERPSDHVPVMIEIG